MIEILFQDAHMLVCVKPAGVLSENGGMPELLQKQLGGDFFCVHRLDRDVGGVMVYARDRQTAARLSAGIADRKMEKTYLAVVEGRPEEDCATLTDLLYHDAAKNKSYVVRRERRGVKQASLSYRLLAAAETEQGSVSLLRIWLHTGRSHQIRVQFASRKMPLWGDTRYGSRIRGGQIALWSERLCFPDPFDGQQREWIAPPPACAPWSAFS